MARTIRSPKLDTRTSRLKLRHRVNPYWVPLEPTLSLGYYRPESPGPGSWIARYIESTTRDESRKKLGAADDYSDANGRHVLTFAQAQREAREWLEYARAEATGEGGHRGPFTVAHAMRAYLDNMDHDGKKSATDARKRASHHILPVLGGVEVQKLTRVRLEKWLNALAAAPRLRKVRTRPLPARPRKSQIGPPAAKPPTTFDEKRARKASANRILSTLKAALNYAKTRGLVRCSDDAWRSVRPFRNVEEPRQVFLTPNDQQRLLNVIPDADFKRLVTGALLTGCRYGELTRMHVRDLDLVGGTILIRESKGGKPRRALLTDEGRSYFAELSAGQSPGDLLFRRDMVERRGRKGRGDESAWGPSEQSRRMHDACERAGLPKMGFHQLRHSYASALVAAGMPLAYVAQLTGHADTRMLERHYAHLAPSDISRSLEALAPKLGLGLRGVIELEIRKNEVR